MCSRKTWVVPHFKGRVERLNINFWQQSSNFLRSVCSFEVILVKITHSVTRKEEKKNPSLLFLSDLSAVIKARSSRPLNLMCILLCATGENRAVPLKVSQYHCRLSVSAEEAWDLSARLYQMIFTRYSGQSDYCLRNSDNQANLNFSCHGNDKRPLWGPAVD